MAEESKISWTHGTFNPWWGCTKVSPACDACYAERDSQRFAPGLWGKAAPRRFFGDKHWNEPLRWNAKAQREGRPFRVFCASMADVFEDRRDLDAPRERLWDLIERTPFLTWLILTKRADLMTRLAPERWAAAWPTNVWAMTTVEDQKRADQRIPHLLKVPAVVRGLSVEPIVGPVDLTRYLNPRWACSGCGYRTNENVGRCYGYCQDSSGKSCDAVACPGCRKFHYWTGSVSRIHWVITGGESGPTSRPMHPDWARKLRDDSIAAGAAFHIKQWGEWAPDYYAAHVEEPRLVGNDCWWNLAGGHGFHGERVVRMIRVGKKMAVRTLDGRIWDEYPTPKMAVAG
jgi:protein gp37